MNTAEDGALGINRPLENRLRSAPADIGGANRFAVLTSPGPAAIAVIQLCGPAVPQFAAARLRPMRGQTLDLARGKLALARLYEDSGEVLDTVLVAVSARPAEWEARLFLHGSPWVVRRCCELLVKAGFSQRETPCAELWPARDFIESEAYALLPQMQTLEGATWLLGQAKRLRRAIEELLEQDWREGRQACRDLAERLCVFDWYSRPARVALVGPTNAGKSTLANALAQQEVSLTSAQPGTTRDWVEVPVAVRGFPMVWLDTAGLVERSQGLEAAALEKTRQCVSGADAVVLVLDGTSASVPDLRAVGLNAENAPTVVALNKTDRADFRQDLHDFFPPAWRVRIVAISAAEGTNLAALEDALVESLGRHDSFLKLPGAFTARQAAWLKAAAEALDECFYRTALEAVFSPNDATTLHP